MGQTISIRDADSHEVELSAKNKAVMQGSRCSRMRFSTMAISMSHMFFAAPTNPVKSVSNMVRLIVRCTTLKGGNLFCWACLTLWYRTLALIARRRIEALCEANVRFACGADVYNAA